ncbi:hypothetical protein ACFLUH_00760 [Chloroflexota bacterium]
MKHASWIKHLGEMTEIQAIVINESRFNPVAVPTMMNYLKEELVRLTKQGISLIESNY